MHSITHRKVYGGNQVLGMANNGFLQGLVDDNRHLMKHIDAYSRLVPTYNNHHEYTLLYIYFAGKSPYQLAPFLISP